MGNCLAERCKQRTGGERQFCNRHWARLTAQSRSDILYLRELMAQGKGDLVVHEGPSRTRTIASKYRRVILYAQRWIAKCESRPYEQVKAGRLKGCWLVATNKDK